MIGNAFIHLTARGVYGLIADLSAPSLVRVIAAHFVPCDGYQGGEITDRAALLFAVKEVLTKLERTSAMRVYTIKKLVLTSPNIRSISGYRDIDIGGIIAPSDLARVLAEIKREMKPDEYLLDYQRVGAFIDNNPCTDVVGLSAQTLGLGFHLSVMRTDKINDLGAIFAECGVRFERARTSELCVAEYALRNSDKKEGTALIDIGHGTVSVCIYSDGYLLFSGCFNGAGQAITEYLAAQLGLSVAAAEHFKINQASLDPSRASHARYFHIQDNGKTITFSTHRAYSVILGRYHEIFSELYHVMLTEGLHTIKSVILTGGGAKMHGLVGAAREFFSNKGIYQVSLANRHEQVVLAGGVDSDTRRLLTQTLDDSRFYGVLGAAMMPQGDFIEEGDEDNQRPVKNILQKIKQFFKQ